MLLPFGRLLQATDFTQRRGATKPLAQFGKGKITVVQGNATSRFIWHEQCSLELSELVRMRDAFENHNHAVMLNPFVNLSSTAVELELKRRERLRIGVYSFLMATLLLLMGLLIQGCRAEQKPAVLSPRQVHLNQLAESGNNPPPSIAAPELTGQTQNSEPAAAVPAANSPEAKPTVGTSLPSTTVLTAPSIERLQGEPSGYVVKRGDTLSAIAKAHRTTAKALKEANGLTGDRIQIGEKLRMPVPTLASLAR